MSFGKSSSTTTQELTPEQKAQIAAQTQMLTGTIIPTYTGAVQGAKNVYENAAPGIQNAAQNLAGVASQAGQTFGETGENALRTGVAGLESLFNPDYESKQIAAAMQPAQAQYLQNVANQEATFGGTGNLGSARQALAERQLAGTTQATQAQTAAQVQANIAQQRAAAAQSLAGIGSGGLTSAQQAAQNVVTAGMTPQQLYNQYASVIFGTPSSSYATNFAGTQGQTKTGGSLGINI
jgi:hypothetical protein